MNQETDRLWMQLHQEQGALTLSMLWVLREKPVSKLLATRRCIIRRVALAG